MAPTQWAVGDCSPRKESPGRGPAARRAFFRIIGQINDFFIEIDIILLRIVFSDGLDFNVSHGSCRIIKKESKIVEKVFLSVFLVTFFCFLMIFDIVPWFSMFIFENVVGS